MATGANTISHEADTRFAPGPQTVVMTQNRFGDGLTQALDLLQGFRGIGRTSHLRLLELVELLNNFFHIK